MHFYTRLVVVLSGLFVTLGLALLVFAAVDGRGLRHYLLGALFVGVGAARLTLERARRR